MPRNRLLSVGIFIVVVGLAAALFVQTSAPSTSTVVVDSSAETCPVPLAAGGCAQLPTVSGTTLNNDPVTFPADLKGEYNLVVMPFDRDQQTAAVAYVPLFQALAAEYTGVAYYSIAALPDLSAPVRLLITGGMNAIITDATLRPLIALLYLDDQASFIAALGIADTEQIRVLIVNQTGQVLWQGVGNFSDANATAIQEALAGLVAAE